ncbi:MAG: HD domain-containing protein [Opitutaceae bacterium]|nr:HD domain-containing protein [Opitutaceae bacterium]
MTADSPEALETLQKRVDERFALMHAGSKALLFDRVLRDVAAMFAGRYLDYRESDTPYHDLAHTLAVTDCFCEIAFGRWEAKADPQLEPRLTELGLVAALLHDTGYLKLRSDHAGTGAKYTFTHVLRSCAVASSYLPPLGVTLGELETVLGAIRCTAPTADFDRIHFSTPGELVLGFSVATADLVGQMAQPDYIDALPKLFAEFEESDEYAKVPPDQRAFRSAEELIAHTPVFWETVVKPKLDGPLKGQYHYLARPVHGGRNAAIEAIEANVARVRRS